MPTPTLTDEQRAALETRDVSVALSAGAGCGKTFVLTHRFITHFLPTNGDDEPARLNQLIAITFTDAAAREMRARIRSACYEQLTRARSEEEQSYWQRLMREIDSARVSTIHAFCATLLRSHAAAAGLDPLFGVLDQSDADVLQLNVIDDVLREQLAELDAATLDLAAAYGLGRLKEQISALIGHRHDESFDHWLKRTPADVVAAWRTWYEEKALPLAVREIAAAAPIRTLYDQLRDVTPDPKKPKFVEARTALLELLPRLEKFDVSRDDLLAIRESAKVQGVCSAKDWTSADDYGQYRDACKEIRDTIDELLPKPFSAESAEAAARLGIDLLQLTHKVAERYDDRKRAQGKLDFDDLLYLTHKFLTDPKNDALRERLSENLRLLLVDEFQDTDRLQVRLVRALCGSGFHIGRLFFVGDFKQSIYRFRGAQPDVFRELRADVHERGRLPLTLNFRSQPGVLDFANALFSGALRLEDEPYQALRASRAQVTKEPCVEFLWTITPDKNNRGIAGAALEARRLEAQAIAKRLRGLIDGKDDAQPVVDKESKRPRTLKLGDIAILFRTLSDVQVYEEALRAYNLDYYLVGGHAFYAQQEIYDVLNLLRAVASTADEVSLAGVLRSPFFSLADETLFWLADSAGTLNQGLLSVLPLPPGRRSAVAEEGRVARNSPWRGEGALANESELARNLHSRLSPEEFAKATAAANTIHHLRSIKDRVAIAALLAQALDRTGYDAVLLAEFLGQRKLANLHKLMEQARSADQGGVQDLDGFITQLAQLVAHEPKESHAATLPEAADVIRLMTIHHAKGLEFPLVVLPDLDRPPRFGAAPAALHPEFGPLVPMPNDDDDYKKVTTGMSLYAMLEKLEELEERKRLLYVAVTRAADYLILSSSLQGYTEPRSDWMKLLAERFNLETGETLPELPRGFSEPKIHIQQNLDTDHKPTGRPRGPDLIKVLEDAYEIAAATSVTMPREVAPIAADPTARRQFSFSRLTGQLIRIDESGERNHAAEEVTIEPAVHPKGDGRTLGILVHETLSRIDFQDPSTISDWCEHLASQLVLLNTDEACRAAEDLITRFVKSPRGQQIAAARTMHREVEFLLPWPLSELSPSGRGQGPAVSLSNGEDALDLFSANDPLGPIYLRGYIDCLYSGADGRWRIADYKTNDVPAKSVPCFAKRYAMQLYVYAMAAEQALGEPPTELAVYFMKPGVEQMFEWNDAARKSAITMVNEAIITAHSCDLVV